MLSIWVIQVLRVGLLRHCKIWKYTHYVSIFELLWNFHITAFALWPLWTQIDIKITSLTPKWLNTHQIPFTRFNFIVFVFLCFCVFFLQFLVNLNKYWENDKIKTPGFKLSSTHIGWMMHTYINKKNKHI